VCFFTLFFFLFCKCIFSVKVIASQPVRDSGCQYQKPVFRTRLSVYNFFSVFGHTHGLLRLSLRIPTLCSGTTRGYTCVVLVTVAGLLGSFSAWVGQSSPPVVRRAPLRGLESGAAQSAG
jgi:hypothetical protein